MPPCPSPMKRPRTRAQAKREMEVIDQPMQEPPPANLSAFLAAREMGNARVRWGLNALLNECLLRSQSDGAWCGRWWAGAHNGPRNGPPCCRAGDHEFLAAKPIESMAQTELKQAYNGIDKAFCVVSLPVPAAGAARSWAAAMPQDRPLWPLTPHTVPPPPARPSNPHRLVNAYAGMAGPSQRAGGHQVQQPVQG